MIPDPQAVAAIMRETARREILPRFRNLTDADIAQKKPGDPVTTADLMAERRLTADLTALLPGSRVVGEEMVETDPGAFRALAGDAPVWLIDPVDGTRNFARGIDRFAVMVALCLGGEVQAGWIHEPLADETAWAGVGRGAWIGERRLRTTPPAPPADMRGALTNHFRKRLEAQAAATGAAVPQAINRPGCVGIEYRDLAAGRLHFARYGRLKPWDHAAGVLMHREAGGYSALVDSGKPYSPRQGIVEEAILLAPDRVTWEALHRLLHTDD